VVADCRFLMEDDPQLAHRGYWQSVDHPEMGPSRFTSPPYRLDGERIALKRPPLLGEHTEAVLGDILGYSAERIAALKEAGALE
jgi:benzylsuccinate CoA-transferase BbsF subunit